MNQEQLILAQLQGEGAQIYKKDVKDGGLLQDVTQGMQYLAVANQAFDMGEAAFGTFKDNFMAGKFEGKDPFFKNVGDPDRGGLLSRIGGKIFKDDLDDPSTDAKETGWSKAASDRYYKTKFQDIINKNAPNTFQQWDPVNKEMVSVTMDGLVDNILGANPKVRERTEPGNPIIK